MENKIWISFFLMIAGLFGWQANDVAETLYDDEIDAIIDRAFGPEEEAGCPGNIILAYTDTDKYICECVGVECPCIDTDEILSELG